MQQLRHSLLALSLLLAACGGDGDGGVPSGSLLLSADNAAECVGLVLAGGSEVNGLSANVAMLEQQLILSNGTYDCPAGGTYTVVVTGTSLAITFTGCGFDFGEGPDILDGTLRADTINSTTVVFTIDVTVDATATVKGDMTVQLLDGGANSLRAILTGRSLVVSEGANMVALENYRFDETVDMSAGTYSTTASGMVRNGTLGGTVYFETTTPLVGPTDGHPTSGVLLLRGLNGSAIRVTLMGEDVLIEVDANGDGTYESSETVTWSQLDG